MAELKTTVVIPGFMGSALRDARSLKPLWDPIRIFTTDLRRLRLSDSTYQIGACGPLWPVYHRLLRTLRRRGHQPLFFAYDWRLPSEKTTELFAEFVRARLGSNPFNVIAHSMGGLIAARWLADGGVNRFASRQGGRIVCIALPAGGVERAAGALIEGYSPLAFFNIRANRKLVQSLAPQLPPLFEMLPRLEGIFSPGAWPAGLQLPAENLSDAEAASRRIDAGLAALAETGRMGKAATISSTGDETRSWRMEGGKVLPGGAGPGDGWILIQRSILEGVPAFLFRRSLVDILSLGPLAALCLVPGSHPLLPMYCRVRRAALEFIEEGMVRSLQQRVE